MVQPGQNGTICVEFPVPPISMMPPRAGNAAASKVTITMESFLRLRNILFMCIPFILGRNQWADAHIAHSTATMHLFGMM